MSAEFSLRALVRQVRDELGTGDRHVIAEKTLPRIPAEHRDVAFTQALEEVARAVVKDGHPRLHSVPDSSSKPRAGQRNSARSSKVAGIRRVWPELRATYACLDAGKQVADYSSDDLIFVAEHLETQARRNAAKAGNFRKLAALMAKSGAAKVADLPDEVLAAIFRGEAA